MRYELRIPDSVFKQISSFDNPIKKQIAEEIISLVEDPFPKGKQVKVLKGLRDQCIRLRCGDYRIMYEVNRGSYKCTWHRSQKRSGKVDEKAEIVNGV